MDADAACSHVAGAREFEGQRIVDIARRCIVNAKHLQMCAVLPTSVERLGVNDWQ